MSPHPSPAHSSGRRWHHLLLGLGCALLMAFFVFSGWQASATLSALGTLQAQADRIGRLDSLQIQLAEAESSVRGYLLSRNRAYLAPYLARQATIGQTLQAIRHDLAPSRENDAALTELSGLIELKGRILTQAVATGTVAEEAPRKAGSSEGKHYTDRLRAVIDSLKTRELEAGQESLNRSTQYFHRIRWVVTALTLGALTLLVSLYLVLQHQLQWRWRMAELLHSENQRLDALVRERTAELSELASYLTNAREAEQARLARELHDELGALLSAARMDVSWLAHAPQTAPSSWNERLGHLRQTLDKGISLKQRIIEGLRPPLLTEVGLVAALGSLGQDFACSDEIQLDLDLPDSEPDLPPEPALALYRIAQEGLTNIRKHARATRARLALELTQAGITLSLCDNGRGFDPSRTSGRRHGLAGMKHRMQMCRGQFDLNSAPGHGTRLVARIPRSQLAGASADQASTRPWLRA